MTATNHTLTGALIAAAIPVPIIALPLAFGSHFVLDVLPHFGGDQISHTDQQFRLILAIDAVTTTTVLGLLLTVQPAHWVLMFICGLVAASPDLLWLPYWVAELKGKARPVGKLSHFLSWIQWGERSWGWIFELAWFVPAMFLFGGYLKP